MDQAPPPSPLHVRAQLLRALQLDLIGPGPGDALADEVLPGWQRPSNWYLTGFLIPCDTPAEHRSDPSAEADDDGEPVLEQGVAAEDTNEERKAAKKSFLPSSMGVTFLVPVEADQLAVTVTWGDYTRGEVTRDDELTPA